MSEQSGPTYYVLESRTSDMMLIYDIPDPSLRDSWMSGQPFQKPPKQPIVARIIPGNEKGDLLDFFGTAGLMSNAFYEALREAGVDNLDVYDATIQSKDGSVVHQGYKAFNIIGLVRAADLSKTVFRDPPGSHLIDASIERLEIDPAKPRGLKMFRLAEYVGAIMVHEDVKRVLESKGFPHLQFTVPKDYISL